MILRGAGRSRGLVRRFTKGVRSALRNNSSAFGFSVYVTATFGTLAKGPPKLVEVLLFVGGNAAAFTFTEALASKMFRVRPREEPSEVVMLGSAINFFAISLAVLTAWGISEILTPRVAWVLAPFLGSTVFIAISGIEMALARRAEERRQHESDPELDSDD